jgi:hypothetical protein
MNTMPGFTAEHSLYATVGQYRVGATRSVGAGEVVPQQFAECTTNRSCWIPFLMCRDHCTRWNGSSFSSLWYVCGVCFGLFQEFFEFDW